MTRRSRLLALAIGAAVAVLATAAPIALSGCGGDKRELRLIYAGSLIVPFDRLAAEFERRHPDVKVLTSAHGSIQVLRRVSELGELQDLVASADEQLIPPLLYDRDDPRTGEPFATWSVTFASNRMVLAVSPRSRLADELTAGDWYRRITADDVRFGLADPRFDAAGYRSLMVLQLAEDEYEAPFLFEDMTMGRFTHPVTVEHAAGGDVIHVPEILETRRGSGLVLRGSSVHLVALLESGDIDCAFEYESVARQHGLRIVELPPSLDLADPEREAEYGRVSVRLDLRRFASVLPEFRGGLIRYAFTIPANAPEPELAREFVTFLLGPEGRRLLEEEYHPMLEQVGLDHPLEAPEEVRRACRRPG